MSISSAGLGSLFPAHRKIGRTSFHLDGAGSKLAAAPTEPDDAQQGGWPRAALLKMDARFCAAMARALARGLERWPDAKPKRRSAG